MTVGVAVGVSVVLIAAATIAIIAVVCIIYIIKGHIHEGMVIHYD